MSGCENPPQDPNAMVDASSSLEGSTVTYNCLTGFQNNSVSYSYACAGGTWTITGMPCAGEYMIIINPGMLVIFCLNFFFYWRISSKDSFEAY